MSSSWQSMKFRECAELVRDTCRPNTIQGIPYIGLEHIEEGTLRLLAVGNSDDVISIKSCFEPEDILFGKLRPYFRKVVKPHFPGVCSTDIWVVRAKHGIDQGYLFYWMASQEFVDLATQASEGTKMPRAKWDFLERIKKFVPPLPEQRAIAHILGSLDDKIELNRRMNKTLEAMARAIFKSWFVDFDPVHAKAEGRDPGLPDEIAALFPDSFEDSELGEIPKEWRIAKLSELCKTQYGYTASAIKEPVGPRLLRVTDMNKQNWIEWNKVPYCEINNKDSAKYRLEVGDLVVARMADPGKSAIIEQPMEAVFASYLVRLKTETLAHAYFVYGFLKSQAYADYSEGAMGGSSVQKSMNAKVIVDVDLIIPPQQVLNIFLQYILPLRKRLVANCEQSIALSGIRDALLPKLLSGEIQVKDAEKFLEMKL